MPQLAFCEESLIRRAGICGLELLVVSNIIMQALVKINV